MCKDFYRLYIQGVQLMSRQNDRSDSTCQDNKILQCFFLKYRICFKWKNISLNINEYICVNFSTWTIKYNTIQSTIRNIIVLMYGLGFFNYGFWFKCLGFRLGLCWSMPAPGRVSGWRIFYVGFWLGRLKKEFPSTIWPTQDCRTGIFVHYF